MGVKKMIQTRARRAALPAGVLTALILLCAWLINHLGGGAGLATGSGSNNSPPAPPAAPTPATTMEVRIRDDRYLVQGKEVPLDQVVGQAAGANVKILSGPDARMGTERDLETALNAAHVSWALEAQPVTGQ
jgi:hypothetical protein